MQNTVQIWHFNTYSSLYLFIGEYFMHSPSLTKHGSKCTRKAESKSPRVKLKKSRESFEVS